MPANTTQPDDNELLALIREPRTSEQGFRILVGLYQERLYWHIRRLVGGHDDADDVLQNTFIKAYRGIGQFKGESKLYSWLYRIATNETVTFINKEAKRSTDSLDNPDAGHAARMTATESPDGEALRQLLDAAIAKLPEKQRIVFNLRYFDEMPYEEISVVVGGTSVGALKASYHHAVKKIEDFIRKS